MINKLIATNKIKELKIQNKLIYSIHFISIVASFVLSEIYFFSAKGVDFPKYRIYLDYLNGSVIQTEQNQGLFYYLTNYLIILLKQSSLTSLNEELFLNTTIQTTNFMFFVKFGSSDFSGMLSIGLGVTRPRISPHRLRRRPSRLRC